MDLIEQKANELIDKFIEIQNAGIGNTEEELAEDLTDKAKQCALICVDEKITTMNHVKELYGLALKTVLKNDEIVDAFRYWCDNSISDLEQVKERLLTQQEK